MSYNLPRPVLQNNLVLFLAAMTVLTQAMQTHQAVNILWLHQSPDLRLQFTLYVCSKYHARLTSVLIGHYIVL